MRNSVERLPAIIVKGSPRQSPLRNPFDILIATGSIKPVCHKTRQFNHSKPPQFRLPSLSPLPILTKVKSQQAHLTKGNFYKPSSQTPSRKSSDHYTSPLLPSYTKHEITFGPDKFA